MNRIPKVLLLGDSIRMSYWPIVKRILAGEAEVVAPTDNCAFAAYTREHLPAWLDELGRPDIVHWNNGLHDVAHNPPDIAGHLPVDAYLDNLRAILAMLRATGARVIWATTTPVHPTFQQGKTTWVWNDEIDWYNAAASAEMTASGVPIDDLHAIVAADIDGFISEDGIHLTQIAQRACAEAAVAAIRKEIAALSA
jgi:lysophospholipase L1-like esterase